MAVAVTACACGRPRRPVIAPANERTAGPVTLRLEGVGAWRCDAGHVEAADRTLATRLRAALATQVVQARRRRFRGVDRCGLCAADLTMPARSTETPVVDDTGPTVVTLTPTMPLVRCPQCGREQVPSEVGGVLQDLLDLVVADVDDLGGPPGAGGRDRVSGP